MQKTKKIISLAILFSFIILAAACGNGGSSSGDRGKVIKSAPIGNGLSCAASV